MSPWQILATATAIFFGDKSRQHANIGPGVRWLMAMVRSRCPSLRVARAVAENVGLCPEPMTYRTGTYLRVTGLGSAYHQLISGEPYRGSLKVDAPYLDSIAS